MYAILAPLSLLLVVVVWKRRPDHDRAKPPGPPRWPLIGNLFDIPRKAEVLTYNAMADQYGDIVYMSFWNTHIFIISSFEALDDLFNKRSVKYSDRPYSAMLHSLMDLEWIFAFRSYGKIWRNQRKLFHSQFQESVVSHYQPILLHAARDLIPRIVASPDDLLHHLHTHVASFLLGVTYGMKLTPNNDRIVKLADEVIAAWSKVAVPGAYLVDVFTFLRYIPELLLPRGGFHKEARETKEKAVEARHTPFQKVIDEMAEGDVQVSFVSKAIEEAGSNVNDIGSIEACAGTAYFAGTEAIAIVLQTFILAMVVYPDVFSRAQSELDKAVGTGRLPNFDDQKSLPYINALVREVIRWNPPAPLAIPHVSSEADDYKGYHVPAGSIIIGNLWKVLHNPEIFPRPMEFNPTRFMSDEKGADPTIALKHFEVAYGCGRRACPGRFVALEQLFITIATVLCAFNIQPGLDDDGATPAKVKPDFTFGLASYPRPFKFKIALRGDYVLDLLSIPDSH